MTYDHLIAVIPWPDEIVGQRTNPSKPLAIYLLKRNIMRLALIIIAVLVSGAINAQQDIVTYAGSSGREIFYDVSRSSNGTFLVAGSVEDLGWIDAGVPRIVLPSTGISDRTSTERFGYILHLSSDLQQPLHVVHIPAGAAEDIRSIKQSNVPNATTDDLFISGNTSGGYFLGKLDGNFVDGPPNGFAWVQTITASGYVKENHPWDVGSDGKVVYITGQTHAYDRAAMHRLNANGVDEVVNDWRVHWKTQGGEWYGTPAST